MEQFKRRFNRYATNWDIDGGKILDVSEKGFAFINDKNIITKGDIVGISLNIYEPYLFGRIMRVIKPRMFGVELESQLTQRLQARTASDLLRSYHDQVERIVDCARNTADMKGISLILLGKINWVQPDFYLDENQIVADLIHWFQQELMIQKQRNNPLDKLLSYTQVINAQGYEEKAVEYFQNILLKKIFTCDSVHVQRTGKHTKEELEKEFPWIASLFFQQEIVVKATEIAHKAECLLSHKTDLFKSVVNEFDMAILLRTASENDDGDLGELELF